MLHAHQRIRRHGACESIREDTSQAKVIRRRLKEEETSMMRMRVASAVARSSLLVRFSLLSLVVLLVIGVALGWMLQQQMERTALQQQAAEVAVVIDGVFRRPITAADLHPTTHPHARTTWATLARRLLAADRHLVRIKVWDTAGRVIYSNNRSQIG